MGVRRVLFWVEITYIFVILAYLFYVFFSLRSAPLSDGGVLEIVYYLSVLNFFPVLVFILFALHIAFRRPNFLRLPLACVLGLAALSWTAFIDFVLKGL